MRFRRSGVNWEGRRWSTSPALNTLMDEVEARFPAPHYADGTVASRGHDQASPASDHRPRPTDASPATVNAVDVGEKVEDDGQALVDAAVAVGDPRIRYVIHEDRIWRSYPKPGVPAWQPAPYTGYNRHLSHVHVSVDRDPALYTDPSPFNLFTRRGEDMSFSKGLDEAGWRTLYARGIAKAPSEEILVDYWVTHASERSDAEHDEASANMFLELTARGGITEDQVRGIVSQASHTV